MHPIAKTIHGEVDIYDGILPSPPSAWETGWGGDSAYLVSKVASLRPEIIIEVGSWLGESAITMAQTCCQSGRPEAGIICVDTWLGSAEHWVEPELKAALMTQRGRPRLYEAFLSNVVGAQCTDNIVPFPISSEAGALALDFWGVKADLIYLDGSHEETLVALELVRYSALLRPGGVIFGHDYHMPGVKKAVDEYCARQRLKLEIEQGCWVIEPSR